MRCLLVAGCLLPSADLPTLLHHMSCPLSMRLCETVMRHQFGCMVWYGMVWNIKELYIHVAHLIPIKVTIVERVPKGFIGHIAWSKVLHINRGSYYMYVTDIKIHV